MTDDTPRLRPLGRRVLLRRVRIAAKVGAIHIPEKARTVPQEGTVVAIGPEVTTVSIGDQIFFGRNNAVAIPGSPDLCLTWESDLMAVVDA